MKLKVNEIFYSLQGEGGRQGEASIFIRLAGCNLRCDFCDTEFESGSWMDLPEILEEIKHFNSSWIIWTGGEPTLQLTDEILHFFRSKGYKQALESNGTAAFSDLFDYTVCSPKNNFAEAAGINQRVNEIRIPVRAGDRIPEIRDLPRSDRYYLSPIFEPDETKTGNNIAFCIEIIRNNPAWRLSLQMHKLIGIK